MDFIYEDLDAGPPIELEFSKLQQDNADLHTHIRNLESDVKRMSTEIAEMKVKQATLEENMSSLFKTARSEIDRKNRMIEELNRRIDELSTRKPFAEDGREMYESRQGMRYRSRSPRSRSPGVRYDRGRGRGFAKRRWQSVSRRGSPDREFYAKRNRFDDQRHSDRHHWRDKAELTRKEHDDVKCRQRDKKSDEQNSFATDNRVDLILEEGEVVDCDAKATKGDLFPPLRRTQPQTAPDKKPEVKTVNSESNTTNERRNSRRNASECRQPNKPRISNESSDKGESEPPFNYKLHPIEMDKMHRNNLDECKSSAEIKDNVQVLVNKKATLNGVVGISKKMENERSDNMVNSVVTECSSPITEILSMPPALLTPLPATPCAKTPSSATGNPRLKRRHVAFKMLD